ncbi:MAG: PTS IIA-like nitrogen regulatory protein PtsN [Gammaproteobacteria bacterium]|nr:PTS IIA-like nitrogen regulatory protein PtsN [Gammaproteobacteria bacterium]
MNRVGELLTPSRVACRNIVGSKKRAFEMLSELVSKGEPRLNQSEVFASLIERERLGCTGLGHGVAIPHGRLKGLNHAVCAFMKLNRGVDYDAADEKAVDMICALLVPEQSTQEHLDILATLAEMFSDPAFCAQVHAAKSDEEVYRLLVSWQPAENERAAGPAT